MASSGDKDTVMYERIEYLYPLQAVKAFENAVFRMNVGDISEPVRTPLGFHIIRIDRKIPNPGKVRVAHILVGPEQQSGEAFDTIVFAQKAKEVYEKLKNGEKFEDLVPKYSIDGRTYATGGAVPYFGLGEMVKPFEQAAFALKEINDISEPVQTRYGYHIIKLLDRKPQAPYEEVEKALRKGTIDMQITPVFCGSSYKNKGVQLMLDGVVKYLPSPLDVGEIKGINPKTEEEEVRKPDDKDSFSALVFKIVTDPYVGKLSFIRIYSGTLAVGSSVYNSKKAQMERIGRIVRIHADNRTDIEEAYAGDIVAIVGLKISTTGETLCDKAKPIALESMVFPDPVIKVAIEPKTKASQEKMANAIVKLQEEDPTFRAYTDKETGQTIIAGMGELHLDIIVDRMFREFKVEANVGQPQVSYKETIRKSAQAEGKYIRQSGGHGQYGHCVIVLEPNEGKGYEFTNETVGGIIPKEFANAINEGIKDACKSGVLAGYDTVDFKVKVIDGSTHEVDSSEMAFKIAGSMAFRAAAEKANPVLLEPIMKVEVKTPDDYLGDVMKSITGRRGSVKGIEAIGGSQVVESDVPLSEMFGYATALRSVTQGRASFTMIFDRYAEVPKNVAEKIIQTGAKK